MIELTLPWPPSVNVYKKPGRMVTTQSGKLIQTRVDTKETTMFDYQVWALIKSKKAKEGLKSFDREAIVGLEVLAYPPDAKRRDIDNILKVLVDSLVRGGLIPDDFQISRLLIQRCGIVDQGKVVVRIYEL